VRDPTGNETSANAIRNRVDELPKLRPHLRPDRIDEHGSQTRLPTRDVGLEEHRQPFKVRAIDLVVVGKAIVAIRHRIECHQPRRFQIWRAR
jgi:hypothetical protein